MNSVSLPLSAQLINLFAAVMLLLAFAMLAQRRILPLINLFAFQGFVLFLSTVVMLGANYYWPGDAFLTWGWRVPFFLSIILVGIGLWIRLGILETPVFQKLLAQKKIVHAPVIEVFKKQPKQPSPLF